MKDKFIYYSTTILNGMNSVERLTGEKKMFHELLPEFTKNFWDAHTKKDIPSLKILSSTLDKIIDDLNSGNSFLLDRLKQGEK